MWIVWLSATYEKNQSEKSVVKISKLKNWAIVEDWTHTGRYVTENLDMFSSSFFVAARENDNVNLMLSI